VAVSDPSEEGGVLPCLEVELEGLRLTLVVVMLPCFEYIVGAEVSNELARDGFSFFIPLPSTPAGKLSPRESIGRPDGSSTMSLFTSGPFWSVSSSDRRLSPMVFGVLDRELLRPWGDWACDCP